MEKKYNILIIDDEENLAFFLSKIITSDLSLNSVVEIANTADIAIEKINSGKPDIILCDIKLDDINGIDLLKKAKLADPDVQVIIMTGFASIDSAIAAIRKDAFDYITKPFDTDEMISIIKKALDEKIKKDEKNDLITSLKETNIKLINQKDIVLKNLEYKTTELEKLHNFSTMLSESIGLATLIKIIPKILTITLECDGAFLSWYNEETHTLTVRSSYNIDNLFPRGQILDCSHPPFDLIFKKKQKPVIVENFSCSPDIIIQTLVVSQLHGGDKPFGLLGLICLKETHTTKIKYFSQLLTISAIVSFAIKNSEFYEKIKRQELGMLSFIMNIAENFGWSRDRVQEIALLSVNIGKKLDLSEKIIKPLRYASLIFSLGFITSKENDINAAVDKALEIIYPIDWLSQTKNIIKYSLENYNGTGREGLKESQIPVGSRILRIVYDYSILQQVEGEENKLKLIKNQSEIIYDPKIVDLFETVLSKKHSKEK